MYVYKINENMLISYMYTFQRGGNVAFQKGKKEKEKKNAQDSGVVLVCLRVAARQVKYLPQRAPVKRARLGGQAGSNRSILRSEREWRFDYAATGASAPLLPAKALLC